jgi:probable HAF family extracellular repeat protein
MSLRARPIRLMGLFAGLASFAFAQGLTATFTTLDDPLSNCGAESACTIAYGINDAGQIVGYYFNSGHHGFLYNNGTFTTLDDPLATGGSLPVVGTNAYGINSSGLIVGNYIDGNGRPEGFLYVDGSFFSLEDPLATSVGATSAYGINASAQIVGSYNMGPPGCAVGFLYSGGTFSEFNFSTLTCGSTIASGINNAGQIVGSYTNASGTHGFMSGNEGFTTLDDPLATGGTWAYGINDAGQIVGSYVDAIGSHGFLYSNGTFTTLDDPLAIGGTVAYGINAADQIVGSYYAGGGYHGFVATPALEFYPVTPCRLVDTRGVSAGFNGIVPFSGPSIPSGGTLTIPVQSTAEASANTAPAPCGTIPSNAQAYSLNVTVVPQAGEAVDYVTLWPAGGTQPFVSTLNDTEGLIVSNAAIVPAGTPSGGISVYNAGPATTDVVIDMNGYFAASATEGSVTGLDFYPVSPCRLVDTRGVPAGFNGIAPFSGPSIPAAGTITIPVQSSTEASADTLPAPCGTIPSTAQAYSFNVAAVSHAGAVDYVTLWPSGATKPYVATLDDPEGSILANAAIVPAGTSSGGVSVFNFGPATTDVVIDMNGYFAPPVTSGLRFYPVSPCRLVDTRGFLAGFNGISPFSGPSIATGGTLTIPVQSAAEASANTTPAPCGVIPSSAQAYALNITVVPQGGAVDYISLWPSGIVKPFVATLNDPQGKIVANAAIVPAGSPSGGISVFNAGPSTTDIVIDMNGYFAP